MTAAPAELPRAVVGSPSLQGFQALSVWHLGTCSVLGMDGFDNLGDLFQGDRNGMGLIPGSAVSQQCRAGKEGRKEEILSLDFSADSSAGSRGWPVGWRRGGGTGRQSGELRLHNTAQHGPRGSCSSIPSSLRIPKSRILGKPEGRRQQVAGVSCERAPGLDLCRALPEPR